MQKIRWANSPSNSQIDLLNRSDLSILLDKDTGARYLTGRLIGRISQVKRGAHRGEAQGTDTAFPETR